MVTSIAQHSEIGKASVKIGVSFSHTLSYWYLIFITNAAQLATECLKADIIAETLLYLSSVLLSKFTFHLWVRCRKHILMQKQHWPTLCITFFISIHYLWRKSGKVTLRCFESKNKFGYFCAAFTLCLCGSFSGAVCLLQSKQIWFCVVWFS